jgi:hypothetical protein
VAEALKLFLAEEPIGRGLRAIAEKFRSSDAEGPAWVAEFIAGGDVATTARIRQDAFMTVQEVCRLLGMVAS